MNALEKLRVSAQELKLVSQISALLDWDQKTNLPPQGQASRAQQLGYLAVLLHQKGTSPALLKLIEKVEREDPDNLEACAMRRDFEISVRIPEKLVEDMAYASSLAGQGWEQARREDNFNLFSPHLSRLIELSQQTAEALSYQTTAYDALLDLYEQDMTAAEIEKFLAILKPAIHKLLINQPPPDLHILQKNYPIAKQAIDCECKNVI